MSRSRSLDLNLPQNFLAEKTNAELKKLSEDNSKLVEFFSTLSLQDIENAKKKIEDLANENKVLAGDTCSLKSQFESLKAALTERSLEAAAQKADYEKRFAELKTFSQNDHASILKALQEVKKTEEQRSEGLVDGFLSGKQSSTVEEFVQQYFASRKLYWLRKTKADKLEEQIKAMPPKRTGSSILPVSKSTSASPSVPNPQGQSPYQPTASLPPAFPQLRGNVPPTQSLQYSRPPPSQPYAHPGYPPPPQPRPYGPPPPGRYQPPGTYPGYAQAPYQSIGHQPPPRPQSQPYPYPTYRPPY